MDDKTLADAQNVTVAHNVAQQEAVFSWQHLLLNLPSLK